jgi:hypothetical protein
MEITMNSDLLNAAAAATYLKIAKQTLAIWRLSGRGPAFVKIGRRVAYRKAELDKYVEAHTYSSTSQYGGDAS